MFSFPRSRAYDDYDEEDDGFSRIETLESRATFRILQPKKKNRKGLKAALVKLPDSGSTSEAEATLEAEPVSSPHLRLFTETTTATTPAKINRDNEDNDAVGRSSVYFDSDPTPKGTRLDNSDLDYDAFPALGAAAKESHASSNVSDCDLQTQEAIDKVMLHIQQSFEDTEEKIDDNDFDCLDWDPDLPPATTSESPEPVTIKPQPVAYTTVGSLVDPNAKLQFAPPKRVNREGAGRAPLMSMLQGARYEPYYQPPRGPPPSLNKANSMAYAQRIGKSPRSAQSGSGDTPETRFTAFSQPAKPMSTPPTEDLQLTDQEREILLHMRREKEKEKENRQENKQAQITTLTRSPSTPTPSTTRLSAHAPPFSSTENSRTKPLELLQEVSNQPNVTRLSTFENGVERFPLFSTASSSPRFRTSPDELTDDGVESNSGVGELNRKYQFPPPARSMSTSTAQPNSLRSIFGKSKPPPVAVPTQRPGYPQPLTAGPPGPRLRQSTASRPTTNQMENNAWANAQPSSSYSAFNTQQQQSPWSNNYIAEGTPNIYAHGYGLPPAYYVKNTPTAPAAYYINPTAPSKVIDTLPPKAVAQYYPQGIPQNMSGYYTPLLDKTKKQMDRIGASAELRKCKKEEDLDEWFYSGQRRFATMTTEDYITELEELEHPNPYGPIAPPKKDAGPGPVIKKPFTVEEMKAMPLDKAVAPLLNNAFGTMLSYAAEGVSSRKKLSGWVVADADQIDDTQEGNRSLFGEDWGAPPRSVPHLLGW